MTEKEAKLSMAKNIFINNYNDGNISFEQFLELSQQNCYYCGVAPGNKRKLLKSNGYCDDTINKSEFIYNGLDRIDNNKKHDIDNVVTSCKWCNISKGTQTQQEFYNWIKNLYDGTIKNGQR